MSEQVQRSVQWRCPNMQAHERPRMVPVPCADCYSLEVTSRRVPYRKPVHRHDVTLCGNCGGEKSADAGHQWEGMGMCRIVTLTAAGEG